MQLDEKQAMEYLLIDIVTHHLLYLKVIDKNQ